MKALLKLLKKKLNIYGAYGYLLIIFNENIDFKWDVWQQRKKIKKMNTFL